MSKQQLSFFQDSEKEKRKITLSLDKLYIIGVVILIGLVACFGLGVEKGRRLSLAGLNRQEVADQSITKNISQPGQTLLPREISPLEGKKEIIQDLPQEPKVRETIERAKADQDAKPGLYYSIQVASFKNTNKARLAASNLEKKGLSPVIVRPGDEWTALCVGRFTTIEDAKELAKSLKDRYSDCFVRKL